MRMLSFARRTAKEILRDPLNLAFGLGFPVALLLLMSAIQANVPTPVFEIKSLAPGISVFGLSFMTLFSATLVARDRETAFLERLYTTPMRAADFILGYILPMVPIAVAQTLVCYLLAVVLGLPFSASILYATFLNLPAALFFIALGLLCGSLFTVKQVGGVCGALLTNLCAWLSGAWFDVTLVGGVFEKIASALPFMHAVELQRTLIAARPAALSVHILWVAGYAVLAFAAAVGIFLRRMK